MDVADGPEIPTESFARVRAVYWDAHEFLVLHPPDPGAPTKSIVALVDPADPEHPLFGEPAHDAADLAQWGPGWLVAAILHRRLATDERPATASVTLHWRPLER